MTSQSFGPLVMSDIRVGQALFGYSKGHRLLAGSVDIDIASARLLRTASDMAFDGDADEYISVLPVPGLGAQAIIRTWPAVGWVRPGSVWSHVLLLDFVDVGRLETIASVVKLFRRPAFNQYLDEEGLIDYRRNLQLPRNGSSQYRVDATLATELLSQLYASPKAVSVGVLDTTSAEDTLFAIFDQQWPRLRRTFAFRTRYRTSASSWNVDLEVVERAAHGTSSKQPARDWVATLTEDLRQPSMRFRSFLKRYGAECQSGRVDMSVLTEVFADATLGKRDPESVVKYLRAKFPAPDMMRSLKRDLLGTVKVDMGSWPDSESSRIRLALEVGESVDLSELHIGSRLAQVAMFGEGEATLIGVDLEALPPMQLDVLMTELASGTSVLTAARIATMNADLGLLIAARRPEVLAVPEIWSVLDEELLVEVFDRASEFVQTMVLDDLLDRGGDEAIARICTPDPQRWWQLLLRSARSSLDLHRLVSNTTVLRRALDRLGAAALDAPLREPRSHDELVTLLLSADMSAGLWRRCRPEYWLQAVRGRDRRRDEGYGLPRYAQQRLNTAALMTSTASGQPSLRQEAWIHTFPSLHDALKNTSFDGEAWALLANSLPTGPDWDRCYRLRRGAVAEIRRDHWNSETIRELIASVGPDGEDMRAELDALSHKSKKKGWLREVLKMLS